jgi:hypothetical protein
MWIRWALLIALIYILYRLFRPARTRSVPKGGPSDVPREEVMVQDPSCRAFIPRSQALEFRSGEEVIYFCSAECRDRYLKGEGG